MKSFSSSIMIRARAETVWALLINAAGYPQWNSTIAKIDGRIAAGEQVTLHAKAAPTAAPARPALAAGRASSSASRPNRPGLDNAA